MNAAVAAFAATSSRERLLARLDVARREYQWRDALRERAITVLERETPVCVALAEEIERLETDLEGAT